MIVWYVRRITLNTAAALVPRAMCSSLRSPVQQRKKMRTVPSCREKLYAPSRLVVTIFNYCPNSSWQFLLTVPSRHEKKRSLYLTVPSRRENSRSSSRPVPSRPIQASILFTILPFRPVPSSNFYPPRMSKQYRPVPSRPVPKITSHETPCNFRNSLVTSRTRFLACTFVIFLFLKNRKSEEVRTRES